ncbi:MAG: tetratricopeptide repeat protein [Planctomycetes bacterium]|nr:tetratricopeptide repeat protein [Planctomycetota bacterium]
MFACAQAAAALLVFIALSGCATLRNAPILTAYGVTGSPQIFEGMGPHTHTITTDSPEAQEYFNQGWNWMYSFNHDEAVRSFTKATELDPECAMAWWGVGYAQGPNYNDPVMIENRSSAAWEALQNALARIENTTPEERALIEALTHRYENPAPKDRKHLEKAFADAMAKVWAYYPNNSDVGVLYAESLMVQYPWKLYTSDLLPAREDTLKIVAVLEQVLAMDPRNPGANHLYIHAIEPSDDKKRGIAAADRLSDLVPGSGHLQHMPSHIYVQVGMWERSIEQNAKAMKCDDRYRVLSPEQGRQHGYMAHNSHMLAFSAMMIGREREAMVAARDMWKDLSKENLRLVGPFLDSWMCSIYDVQKRFGRWDELLAEPAPPKYLPITTAVWRAHRAIAYAAKKDFENAEREQMAFRSAMKAVPATPAEGTYGIAVKFLLVSELFIDGEIALQKGYLEEAVGMLEEAVVIEDALGYGEPPMWLQPVRHTLGAVYLKSGRCADAERVYREDLAKWPGNGWSLYGLSRALERQGKTQEALTVKREYDRAWARADAPTTTSCKCIPKT